MTLVFNTLSFWPAYWASGLDLAAVVASAGDQPPQSLELHSHHARGLRGVQLIDGLVFWAQFSSDLLHVFLVIDCMAIYPRNALVFLGVTLGHVPQSRHRE